MQYCLDATGNLRVAGIFFWGFGKSNLQLTNLSKFLTVLPNIILSEAKDAK